MNEIHLVCEQDGSPIAAYTDLAQAMIIANRAPGELFVSTIKVNNFNLVLHRFMNGIILVDDKGNLTLDGFTVDTTYREYVCETAEIEKQEQGKWFNVYLVFPDDKISKNIPLDRFFLFKAEPYIKELIASGQDRLIMFDNGETEVE